MWTRPAAANQYALRPVLTSLGARHVTAGRFVLDQHIDSTLGARLLTDASAQTGIAQSVEEFRAALRTAPASSLVTA
jgi:FMN reductase